MLECQGSKNALQGTEAPAQQIWPYNSSLHVGMNATSNRDHSSARACIKYSQLTSPSWGKQMPFVLHSKSCWGAHSKAKHSWGHSEGSKSEHRAAMDLSELELSLESDPCLVAMGLRHPQDTCLPYTEEMEIRHSKWHVHSKMFRHPSDFLLSEKSVKKRGSSAGLSFHFICLILHQLASQWYFHPFGFSDRVLNL